MSIPKLRNEYQPITVRSKNKTIVGTGCLIDQAEIFQDIANLSISNWESTVREIPAVAGKRTV